MLEEIKPGFERRYGARSGTAHGAVPWRGDNFENCPLRSMGAFRSWGQPKSAISLDRGTPAGVANNFNNLSGICRADTVLKGAGGVTGRVTQIGEFERLEKLCLDESA